MGDEHSIEKECQTNTRFANMNTSLKNNSYVIFDFSDPQTTSLWKPLNDVIMGGRSAGTMKQASPTSAAFTGVVSLEQGARGFGHLSLAQAVSQAIRFDSFNNRGILSDGERTVPKRLD